MRAVLVMLAVAGCYNPTPPAGVACVDNDGCPSGQDCIAGFCGGSGGSVDAQSDTQPADAPAICSTWQPRHFDPCMLPAPIGDLNLTDALSGFGWDTDAPQLKGKMNTLIDVATIVIQQTGGPDVVVASVNNLTMEAGATLDLNGSRPLLIAVWGTATINGSIDADAAFGAAGPGGSGGLSSANGCGSGPTGDFGAAGAPATGGGGGALQGGGGRGGNTGGAGGAMLMPPTEIRGGCAAGGGGAGSGANGVRGGGGGALQISARQAIVIGSPASIHAAGGGGGGGRLSLGGGGGGGAGGYIGFDAPMVTIAGTVSANGGAGGGGASDVADGTTGANGRGDATAALGGAGAATSNVGACARGGNGSAGGTLVGATAPNSACGGAGGGGGAGYILIWSPTLDVTGTASPPVTAGP
ncbi:MAG TPA: hypothetical protein VIV11_09930 [Kofleriaceae bacterium]